MTGCIIIRTTLPKISRCFVRLFISSRTMGQCEFVYGNSIRLSVIARSYNKPRPPTVKCDNVTRFTSTKMPDARQKAFEERCKVFDCECLIFISRTEENNPLKCAAFRHLASAHSPPLASEVVVSLVVAGNSMCGNLISSENLQKFVTRRIRDIFSQEQFFPAS